MRDDAVRVVSEDILTRRRQLLAAVQAGRVIGCEKGPDAGAAEAFAAVR